MPKFVRGFGGAVLSSHHLCLLVDGGYTFEFVELWFGIPVSLSIYTCIQVQHGDEDNLS